MQELRSVVEKSHDKENGCKDVAAKENGEIAAGVTEKSSSLQEEMDNQGALYSDDDKSGNMIYLGPEEPDLMKVREHIDGSIISPPVKWCSFDAGSLFDQTNSSSHWWDNWT